MRKKRRITKATIVKTWFLFLAITAGLLTSCKDYDDDIDRLDEDLAALEAALGTANTDLNTLKTQLQSTATDSEVAAAVAAAKTEAINTAAANVTSLLTTLKGGYTGTLDDLNDAILDIAGDLSALQIDVSGLATDLDAVKLEVAANKAAIELQQSVLDKYLLVSGSDNVVEAITAIKADLTALQAIVGTTDIAALRAAIDAIEDQIVAIDAALNVLNFADINSMITGITFDFYGDDWDTEPELDFFTTEARVTYTFGNASWASAIKFVRGERQLGEEASVIVKVTPANADLSAMVDQIFLIRSDANNAINSYIKATGATRYTPILTRALPTATGLWEITFNLPAESDKDDVEDLIYDTFSNQIMFGIAINNTVDSSDDAEDRYVVSDFRLGIDVGDKVPVYNDQDDPNDLIFSVKKGTDATYTTYADIKNRYETTENGISCNKDQKWSTGVWNTTATPANDDPADDRRTKNFFGVEVNKTFNVRLDNPDDVYAYYVTLDREWAVESSPSELNAWNSYTYAGLDQVYKADEIAELKVASASANGDIIGFRVYVVNYDGTLVDPDGKSFYTYVGDIASTALAFEQRITAYVPAATAVPSTILPFNPGVSLSNVSAATFTMTIGNGIILDNTNLQLLDNSNTVLGTAATVTNWSNVKKLQIIGVLPSDLQENVAPYSGTLTLLNAFSVPFSTTMVTLTKVMPTFDATLSYKTSIHHNVNGQQVVYAYPMPGTRTYNLGNALNGLPTTPTLGAGFVVTNKSTYPAISLPTWNTTDTEGIIPEAEIGVPYLPAATGTDLHGKIYDLELSKDFGYVLYNGSSSCLIAWAPTPSIKTEFRSFIQDLTDWKFTGTNEANYPALVYGDDLAGYNLTSITALPPAGARVNMTQETGALQDGRTFDVVGVKLLTGANYTIENEYFTPAISGTTIDFTAIITSTPAGPVPTKIQLTLEDDFGHQYVFTVPKIFNMVLN
jgi:hypothetical protein